MTSEDGGQQSNNGFTCGQIALYGLLLSWLAIAPVLAELSLAGSELPTVALLTAGLLLPFGVYAGAVFRQGPEKLRPLALSLLLTALYITAAAGLRAFTPGGPVGHDAPHLWESSLRLAGLVPLALLLGWVGLRLVGVSGREMIRAAGLGGFAPAGLLLALAAAALVTVGWPLSGALGDIWLSLLILLQALALVLPEEIFFRGMIPGLLGHKFPHRKGLVPLLALAIYLAFVPAGLVPRGEWGHLIRLITALPYAMLLLELRALSGGIWAGLLFALLYRAGPPLFTDPRVELPLVTQPGQTIAYVWMMAVAGVLALVLLGGRILAARREKPLPRPALTGAALAAAIGLWGIWAGLWWGLGTPGFHNDGFLIVMSEQADLSGAAEIEEIEARRAFVRERLIETADRSQAPIRAALTEAGLTHRPYYLINMIRVEGHHWQRAEFADLPGVARVMLHPNVRPYPLPPAKMGYGSTQIEGVVWNLEQVEAEAAWEQSVTGRGIVVAGQDTGYDWQHPALRSAYRGYNGGEEADHDYNWHDAWADSPVPFDEDQHGTHTMGTILGRDGEKRIGLAPDARWIGCRNMRRGLGNPASYTECMEFFLAPYPLGGDPFVDGDVGLAPHLVNNSWGCPDEEGCDDAILEPGLEALRAAGIIMVVSAGNDGPGCGTANEPPARYDAAFSVGATGNNGQIVPFSSRGPVGEADPLLKPDIVAPGDNVPSSLPGGDYGTASGTSMAGPHVAGLIALLWSANPALIGQIEATEQIIRQSARPVEVTAACPVDASPPESESLLEELESLAEGRVCACGDVTGTPNNVYGWGEIDVEAALQMALDKAP